MTIALTALLLFSGADCQSQAVGGSSLPGRGAYSRSFINVFSGVYNQAALAHLPSFTAGVFLQQRFSVKALRTGRFAIALPLASGTIALQGIASGYKHFKRQRLDLAYAKKLFEWLDIGVQLNYLNMRVPAYGSAHAFTFTLATLFHINEEIHVGFQVFNPAKAAYQKLGNDPVPVVCRIGLGYQPSKLLVLTSELKYMNDNAAMSLAFQYHIAKVLSLGAGCSTGVNPVFADVHIHLEKMEILLSAAYHRQLGLSPGVGFIFINEPADEL